jgi:hypothetical protein
MNTKFFAAEQQHIGSPETISGFFCLPPAAGSLL